MGGDGELPDPDEYTPRMRVGGYLVPESLKDMEIWVLWDEKTAQGKVPMAPWHTETCYPVPWGSNAPTRPETDYQQAATAADMSPSTVHEHYPFPPDDDGEPMIPDVLTPTILLPHDPPDPPLMQVDFDDVRDPETGAVTDEVLRIVEQLDAYTEVSQSGEGLHTFVRAELPGALGKFIEPLDEIGEIEMYDHGRFVGCTWKHVEDTPETVPERQDVIDDLVETYESESTRERRLRTGAHDDGIDADVDRETREMLKNHRDTSGDRDAGDDSDHSPYYDHLPRTEQIAKQGDFLRYRDTAPGPDTQGPHPAHGPMSSRPEECTNFGISGDGGWWCFAHESGGGALSLFAVCEVDGIGCDGVGDGGQGVRDDPAAMLKTALTLREHADGALDDADPPYMALRGVAEQFDLSMKNSENGVLGESCWNIARKVYDEMEPEDVEL